MYWTHIQQHYDSTIINTGNIPFKTVRSLPTGYVQEYYTKYYVLDSFGVYQRKKFPPPASKQIAGTMISQPNTDNVSVELRSVVAVKGSDANIFIKASRQVPYSLTVTSVVGNETTTLKSGVLDVGENTVVVPMNSTLAHGLYFIVLKNPRTQEIYSTAKLLLTQ